MAASCPNNPAFRYIRDDLGDTDMAYLVSAYLEKIGKDQAALDDGVLTFGNWAMSIDRAMDLAQKSHELRDFEGKLLSVALDSIQDPALKKIAETLDDLITDRNDYLIEIPEKDIPSRKDYEKLLLSKALARIVQNPETTAIFDQAKNRIRNLGMRDGVSLLREVMRNPVMQTRIRSLQQAKSGALWDAIVREIAKQTNLTEDQVRSVITLPEVDMSPGVKAGKKTSDLKRVFDTLQAALEDQAAEAMASPNPRAEKWAKRLNSILAKIRDVESADILTLGIDHIHQEMDKILGIIKTRKHGVGDDLDLETLDRGWKTATAYQDFLQLASTAIQNDSRLKQRISDDTLNQLNEARNAADALISEFRSNAIPILADIFMPLEGSVRFHYKDRAQREFDSNNKANDFENRHEYESARVAYTSKYLADNRDQIEKETKEFLISKLSENFEGDIKALRGYLMSLYNAGDHILALAKALSDKANHDIRLEYIARQTKHDKLFDAFLKERGSGSIDHLYNDFYEVDSKGNKTTFFISPMNEAAIDEARIELEESMEGLSDREAAFVYATWAQENLEQPFTDDVMAQLREASHKDPSFYSKLKTIREIMNKVKGEDGEVDLWAFDASAARNLRVEYETMYNAEQQRMIDAIIEQKVNEEAWSKAKEKAKKMMSEKDFRSWMEEQYYTDAFGRERLLPIWTTPVSKDPSKVNPFYDGKQRMKVEKFRSTRYDAMMSLPETSAIRQYYEFIYDEHLRNDRGRPPAYRKGMHMPVVRKSVIEAWQRRDEEGVIPYMVRGIKRTFDDTDYGFIHANSEGNPIRQVPIFYINKVAKKDGGKGVPMHEVSFDVASIMALETWDSIRYKHISRLSTELEALKRVMAERDVQVQDKSGRLLSRRTGKPHIDKGRNTNAYKILEEFIESEVYGIRKLDEKFLGLQAQVWDNLLQYNSLLRLGGNVRNALVNVTQGNLSIRMEAWSNGLIGRGSARRATRRYWSNPGSVIADVGRIQKQSVTNLIIEYFDGLNEFFGPQRNYQNHRALSRALRDSDTSYAMIGMPEHFVHWLATDGTLDGVLAMNSDGEYIDAKGNVVPRNKALRMSDAFSNAEGSLELNKFFTHAEYLGVHSEVNDQLMFEIANRIHRVNEMAQGAYSRQNKGLIHRRVWGRMMGQMRGWLVAMWDRRWRGSGKIIEELKQGEIGPTPFDAGLGEGFEGNYTTTLRYFTRLAYRTRDFLTNSAVEGTDYQMSRMEKANMIRTAFELGSISMAWIAGNMLYDLAGESDDLEEETLYWMAYIMMRYRTELLFYIWTPEAMKLIRDPAALVSTVGDIGQLAWEGAQFWNWGDKFESGSRKGQTKIVRRAENMIPYWNYIRSLGETRDVIQYYLF